MLDRQRVDADLGLALVAVDEEAVDQVDRPERERRGDEREPEAVHRAEQLAVELEAELLAAVGEQREVDGERAEEVADRPRRAAPLWKTTTRTIVAPIVISTFATLAIAKRDGALLDAEERRHLRVVHLRPEADEAGPDERRRAEVEPVRDRLGEDASRGRARASPSPS